MEINALPNNSCVKKEIKMKIRKYFELNVNKNMIYKDRWDESVTASKDLYCPKCIH